ncbi:hypothetical protein ACFYXM_24325 [Streptomyces sp. NPDC002476]|uniref:hypothetical protein n=1 Tax=Streptomyces sp. NPDC002476 TaxID=3364648 RepID=UPI00369DBBC4
MRTIDLLHQPPPRVLGRDQVILKLAQFLLAPVSLGLQRPKLLFAVAKRLLQRVDADDDVFRRGFLQLLTELPPERISEFVTLLQYRLQLGPRELEIDR